MHELINRIKEEGFESTINKFYSSYRAFVVDNEDPKGMNRLILLVPFYNINKPLTFWAYPKGQKGGMNHGSFDIPNKGDMVWVSFEAGNISSPLWEYASYGENELPDEFETTKHIGYKTPRGTLILINDNKEQEEVLVRLNSTTDWVKINKDVLETESKLIKLGKEQEEHALMGDTTKAKLESFMDKVMEFMDQYIVHTHNTPFGPTDPPLLASETQTTKQGLETLKGELEEILSYKVSIDRGDDSGT